MEVKDEKTPEELICEVQSTCENPQLVETINSLQANLSSSLENLSRSITTSIKSTKELGLDDVFFAIFIVLVSALTAYLFNLLHWRIATKSQKITNLAKSLDEIISDLELLSVKYWTMGYNTSTKTELQVLEISIKSKVLSISRYSKIFISEMKKRNKKFQGKELEVYRSLIFDITTGDEFESQTRKPSNQKALRIANECTKIRAYITATDCINN